MAVALRRVLYTAVAGASDGRPAPTGDGSWQLVHGPAEPDAPSVTNTEELFAAGYASSLSAAFADVAGDFGLPPAEVRVAISVGKTSHGWGLAADLTVRLPGADPAVLHAAAVASTERCPFWATTHANIPTTLRVET